MKAIVVLLVVSTGLWAQAQSKQEAPARHSHEPSKPKPGDKPLGSPPTSHDDPIIINSESSVYVQFSARTRAIVAKQWAQAVTAGEFNGYIRYLQHGHINAGMGRALHSLHRDASSGNMTTERSLQTLSPSDQVGVRVEVFLKGQLKSNGQMKSLGNKPQIVLTAVPESVPCCIHQDGLLTTAPGTLVQGLGRFCSALPGAGQVPSSQYKHSWQIAADQKLIEPTTPIDENVRGVKIWKAQYIHPDYKDVTIDYYTIRKEGQPTWSSRQATSGRKVDGCDFIEMCAAEPGLNGKPIGFPNFCIKRNEICRGSLMTLPVDLNNSVHSKQ